MDRTTAKKTINQYGREKKAFLFIINFDLSNSWIKPLNEIDNSDVLFNINGHTNTSIKKVTLPEINFSKLPVKYEKYSEAFDIVLKNINWGNSYLTNLTQPTEINTNLNLRDIFHLSKAPYKLLFKDQFVVFSPEIFIKISKGEISSYPMKGTIDADLPDAENTLLNDLKETAEHTTIVDLIRNDLSMVASNVHVEKFRYMDKISTNQKNLLQMSSKIVGELPEGFHNNLGDILFSLLPAGSISGAPKKKTIEIIQKAEQYSRGFYTGVMGIFDGENLDSAVMIRYIEKEGDNLTYKSGGGITSFSDCQKEYTELIDKVYLPISPDK